jgi:hypothetical protein
LLQKFLRNLTSSFGQTVAATDYALTTNSTSFKIKASGPGVLVLTEAYISHDFQLRVNGNPEHYFRVNSAFKGIFVSRAGEYVISFIYWPRFFSSSITSCGSVADFVAMVRSGDGKPFAAVQQVDRGALSQPPVDPTAMVKRNIVPARDYLLTNNTTSFTIDVPERGVVVLTETFLAGDFVARINGARAKYLRLTTLFAASRCRALVSIAFRIHIGHGILPHH